MKTAPLTTATRPAITSTAGALSDRELLRETSNLVRHERHLQGAIIDHLAEINARGLYLERGFSSLFDYAVRELGYSDAAAARRIGAMRLCADQPDAREGLRDGSLTLSAAAELQWAFDRQRRRGSICGTAAIAPAGSGAAGSAAQNDPAPDSAPAVPLPSAEPEPPPPLVLDAVGRQQLVEEAAGKSARQVRQMLADLDPELAPPADRVRPLGDGRYELKATIDAECQQGLEQLRGLLSHVDPRMTLGSSSDAWSRRGSTATTRAGHRAERAAAVGPRTRRQTPRQLRRRSRRTAAAPRRRSAPCVRGTPRRRRRPTRTQATTPLPHRRGRFGRYRPPRRCRRAAGRIRPAKPLTARSRRAPITATATRRAGHRVSLHRDRCLPHGSASVGLTHTEPGRPR